RCRRQRSSDRGMLHAGWSDPSLARRRRPGAGLGAQGLGLTNPCLVEEFYGVKFIGKGRNSNRAPGGSRLVRGASPSSSLFRSFPCFSTFTPSSHCPFCLPREDTAAHTAAFPAGRGRSGRRPDAGRRVEANGSAVKGKALPRRCPSSGVREVMGTTA